MKSSALHGTLALVFAQSIYYVLGYIAVVLLARELGPAEYGTYGVIMSVLVWLEQSARRVVPTAAAKLIATHGDVSDAVARVSLQVNVVLHLLLFAVLWCTAPWLAGQFHIDDGVFLIRLAAVDLPLFGVYTALQGIHQGKQNFIRLGVADVSYAVAKVVGVALLVVVGISLANALIVNILATVVGIGFLLRSRLWGRESWRVHWQPLFAIAGPVLFFSVSMMLMSSLDVWVLKAFTTETQLQAVGIYVAALNIARVPGFALSTASQVLLPSVTRAAAAGDEDLIRRNLNHVVRFFLILYIAASMLLLADPEGLMELIYSDRYAGGDVMLEVLVIGAGFWALQAILSSVLIATDRMKLLSIVSLVTLVAALPLTVVLVRYAGGVGAAWASGLLAFVNAAVFYAAIHRRFGVVVPLRNLVRIAVCTAVMAGTHAILMRSGVHVVLSCAAALAVYFAALLWSAELNLKDLVQALPGRRAARPA